MRLTTAAKIRESERLRRERERLEAITAQADRERTAQLMGEAKGERRGRESALQVLTAVSPDFAKQVMDYAAYEFARHMVHAVAADVPARVIGEIAEEVWQMVQEGLLRGLGDTSDARAFVRWRIDERGDLRIDARLPELRLAVGVPREEVLTFNAVARKGTRHA